MAQSQGGDVDFEGFFRLAPGERLQIHRDYTELSRIIGTLFLFLPQATTHSRISVNAEDAQLNGLF